MSVCEGAICRKVGECLGLVVSCGELKFCAGWSHRGWLSGAKRGGHGKCYQMVGHEVKRIRGRGGNWDTTTGMTEVGGRLTSSRILLVGWSVGSNNLHLGLVVTL